MYDAAPADFNAATPQMHFGAMKILLPLQAPVANVEYTYLISGPATTSLISATRARPSSKLLSI